MSREIFVQDLPRGITSVAEIPDDFRPRIIGARSEIIATIQDMVPAADFSDPAWGKLIEPTVYDIEVNLGSTEEIRSFAFHVSGGIEADVLIGRILRKLELRALDPSSETGIFEMRDV